MAQVIYGRKLTAPNATGVNIGSGNAYAQIFPVLASQTGRIIKIGALIGASNQPMNVRLGVARNDSSTNTPQEIIASTAVIPITWNWTSGTGGQNVESNVTYVAAGRGASQSGAIVRDGERLQIVFMGDETARHAYVSSTGKQRHKHAASGTTLPDPLRPLALTLPIRNMAGTRLSSRIALRS